MKVKVKLFAGLREEMDRGEVEQELPQGSTLQDLIDVMLGRHPVLYRYLPSLQFAVNRRYVTGQVELSDGDEVAFLPPVGGG
jgi:molybdopterin synthase sulfur carrier subunit